MTTANTAFISFVCLLLVSIKCKSFHYGIFPPSDGNSLLLLTFQGPRDSLWEIKARIYAGSWNRNLKKDMFSGCFFTFICTLLPLTLLLCHLYRPIFTFMSYVSFHFVFSPLKFHFPFSWSIFNFHDHYLALILSYINERSLKRYRKVKCYVTIYVLDYKKELLDKYLHDLNSVKL